MFEFILNFFIVVLILLSILAVLVVLMQKTSSQAGMGAALTGGGAADQAFGADSATVLTKATQTITLLFFVLSFLLYLGFQSRYTQEERDPESVLPEARFIEESEGADTEINVTPPDSSEDSGEPGS